MRGLRFFLYAFLQLGLIGGALLLYSLVTKVPISKIDFSSGGFITLITFSLAPLVAMFGRKRVAGVPRIPGISSPPFLLRSSYATTVKGTPQGLKIVLHDICNSIVLDDRVFMLDREDELTLEYITEPRPRGLGTREKEVVHESTRVILELQPCYGADSTDLKISSSSEERDVGLNNLTNEENIAAIVLELQNAGLVQVPATRPVRRSIRSTLSDLLARKKTPDR